MRTNSRSPRFESTTGDQGLTTPACRRFLTWKRELAGGEKRLSNGDGCLSYWRMALPISHSSKSAGHPWRSGRSPAPALHRERRRSCLGSHPSFHPGHSITSPPVQDAVHDRLPFHPRPGRFVPATWPLKTGSVLTLVSPVQRCRRPQLSLRPEVGRSRCAFPPPLGCRTPARPARRGQPACLRR